MKKLKILLLLFAIFVSGSLNASALSAAQGLGKIAALTKAYPQTAGFIKSVIVLGGLKIAGLRALIAVYPDYFCNLAKKFLERFDKKSVVIDTKSLVIDNKYCSVLVDKNFLKHSKTAALVGVAALGLSAGSYMLYTYVAKQKQRVLA